WHPHVHEHDVGVELGGEGHGLLAVAGLADDRDVGGRVEDHHQAGPHRRLVVGHQHPDHAGSSAWTRKPPPLGPASNAPPSRLTRSRMPIRPTPEPGTDASPEAAAAGVELTVTAMPSGRCSMVRSTAPPAAC